MSRTVENRADPFSHYVGAIVYDGVIASPGDGSIAAADRIVSPT